MKIAVLVSGGVDSSVALALLKKQGHEVTAFYLKIWLEDELQYLGTCPWEEDLAYIKAVCAQLEVPLQVIPFQQEYWKYIVTYVLDEIRRGRTPNPDVLCNQHIKFGCFLNAIGAEYEKIASGHYAQIELFDGFSILKCSPDLIKDQTYFLCQLSRQQLNRVIFPIGHLTKPEVRVLTMEFDLPNKMRPDSQGICFLGKLKFSDFVRHHFGVQKGELREWETGACVGEHDGYWFYTIGQRHGIGLGGGPWYVIKKDIAHNSIFISKNYYSLEKKRDKFLVRNWNRLPSRQKNMSFTVKLRHGANRYHCIIEPYDETAVLVTLTESDQGIASGQFAVFYQDEYCCGGGIIEQYTAQQEYQRNNHASERVI